MDALRVAKNFERIEVVLEETEVDPDELATVRTVLRRVAGRRDIDETPAALADVAGQVAADVAARAERIRLWAAPASFPLPAAFTEAVDEWAKIAALSNPVHRVHEVHIGADNLERGHTVVCEIASFQADEGTAFVETGLFARDLAAIEHRLAEEGSLRSFLSAWEHGRAARTLADRENWRQLRSLEASARLDLGVLLDTWRESTRKTGQEALRDAAERAASLGVPAGVVDQFSKSLRDFLDRLDDVAGTARIAALPEVARQHADRLSQALLEEAARRRQPEPPERPVVPGDGPPPPKPRSKRGLRVRDLAAGVIIRDQDTWCVLRDQLDREVKALLEGGGDVEIT